MIESMDVSDHSSGGLKGVLERYEKALAEK
jgi:hypothetical protein